MAERRDCLNCDATWDDTLVVPGETVHCPQCATRIEIDPPPDPPPAPGNRSPGFVRSHRAAAAPAPVAPHVPFRSSLAGVFAYPFSSISAVLFLAVLTPLWTMSRITLFIFPFALWACLILGGILAGWFFLILQDTAAGGDRAPGGPPLMDIGELAGHCLRFFGATFVAFWPALVLNLVAAFSGGDPMSHPGFMAAVGLCSIAGALYLPMALMLIGFTERWVTGFNYAFGLRSILRIKGDYLLAAFLFKGTLLLSAGLELLVRWAGEESLSSRIWAVVATSAAEVYFYAVQMRLLGLLYRSNRERLGWFV